MKEFHMLFLGEEYLSLERLEDIKRNYLSIYEKIRTKKYLLFLPSYRKFYHAYQKITTLREENNKIYLMNKKKEWKSFFQNIHGYPLDDYQIECILKEERSLLAIAGAGSGKSLTIVGKIGYLIEGKGLYEKEILAISFTRESALHLAHNIQKSLGYEIPVYTFHKLALTILKETKKEIAPNYFLEELIEEFYHAYVPSTPSLFPIVKQYFFKTAQTKKEEYFQLLESKKFILFKKKLTTFIHLVKANKENRDEIYTYLKQASSKEEYLFLFQACILYFFYQEELEASGMMDFDDMIFEAIQKLKEKHIYLPYRYIIIDEFQDTSFLRCRLIQELLKKTNASFMAVGDDFQSIYRFTGCDLEVFLNFSNYFPFSDIAFLPNTYRNSQELIDVAGSFVMKNKRQIKKTLYSKKHLFKPIKIVYYEEASKTFLNLLDQIRPSDILVLGRNQRDIQTILSPAIIKKENAYTYKNHLFHYQTVHQSKGLEADIVILIHLENSLLGFPNKIEEDSVFRFLNKQSESYAYEEERRLFYVALTRTKNEVYLLTPSQNESIFIRELKRNYSSQIEIFRIK